MSDLKANRQLGSAALSPDGPVPAGSYGTWRLSYTIGSEGLPSGARVRVHTDSDTDWAIAQFADPAGADYMTVEAPEDAHIAVTTQGFAGLVATNLGRALTEGEQISLIYGDRSQGGPGSRAQTFAEARRHFAIGVDVTGEGPWQELPNPPWVEIVGADAVTLVVVAPSTVGVGQPFDLLVRAQDAWGNPSASFRGVVQLSPEALDAPETEHTFSAGDGGLWWLGGCRLTRPGLWRVAARQLDGNLSGESNPIECHAGADGPALYWGDPHGGQLHMAAKIPAFFDYARRVSAIHFAGYQPNAHRVTTSDWAIQQRAEREASAPGAFVPLPGFEWSAETRDGGHHNVYLRRHDQPIRRSCHLANIAHQDDHDTDLPHVLDLHAAYRGTDTVITPHVGGGRADLTFHEPTLEPAIEVTSTHGSFPWFLEDALRRGYQLGFIGGSDGYTGRPGNEWPGYLERRYAKGGLTGLYAEELTIEGVLAALKARHAYGTTGARMLIRIRCQGHSMGDAFSTRAQPTLSVSVAGTAPIEVLELYRGLECIYRQPIELVRSATRVRLLWEGASRRTSYSGVIWDGELRAEGGPMRTVETIRFDSPRSRLFDVSPTGLRWSALTCGYRSGFVIETEGAARFEGQLATTLLSMPAYGGFGDDSPKRISYSPAERIRFAFDLADLVNKPAVVEIGPLDRRLTVSLAPVAGERDIAFEFQDPAPVPGVNPYWVRVIQTDGEMAWTSPIYVDYVSGAG